MFSMLPANAQPKHFSKATGDPVHPDSRPGSKASTEMSTPSKASI